MTENQLVEGRKLLDKIKKHEELIENLDGGCISYIRENGGTMETALYCIDPDLKNIIKEYITNKLRNLQEEFNNL